MKALTLQQPASHSLGILLLDSLMVLALIGGLTGFAIFFEAESITAYHLLNELLSYHLTRTANIILAVSGILYITLIWFNQPTTGRWATGLALIGVIVMSVAFFTRWFESYQVLEQGHIPISNLYEVILVFTLITVTIYLLMERLYRSKSAGAFITPIIFSSIGVQLWLEYSGQANPSEMVPALRSYWLHAHVLANFIGYGAFAVASAAGSMYLVRLRIEEKGMLERSIVRHFPSLKAIDNWIYRSIAIGFPIFALATMLGSAWSYYAWGGYWSWDPKETWALIVILCYAGFLHAHFMKGWSGTVMAWWAILGFIITLICFLGVNLFFTSQHFFGAA